MTCSFRQTLKQNYRFKVVQQQKAHKKCADEQQTIITQHSNQMTQ